MAEELVDIYSDDLIHEGIVSRDEAHMKGLLHRTFHCWISDSEFLYFQMRGNNVDFANLLDVTVGGHIRAGETEIEASREVTEEIGLTFEFRNLVHLGNHYFTYEDEEWRVREIAEVYLSKVENGLNSFKPSREELGGIVAIPFSEGRAFFNKPATKAEVQAILASPSGNEKIRLSITESSFVPGNSRYFRHMFEVAQKFASGDTNIEFTEMMKG